MFCYLFSINWEEVILETSEKKLKATKTLMKIMVSLTSLPQINKPRYPPLFSLITVT